MRHLKGGRKLGRTADARQSLMRSLAIAILKHEQIRTTLPKAKELRRFVEPFVTRARTDSVANRRLAFSRLRDQEVVDMLFRVYGPRYRHRPGGYTRVIKIGFRNGDSAPMALIQFVDQDDAIDATPKPVVVDTNKKQPASDRERVAIEATAAAAAVSESVEAEAPEAEIAVGETVEAEVAGAEVAAGEAAEAEAVESDPTAHESAEAEVSAEAAEAEVVKAEAAAGAVIEESAIPANESDRAAAKEEAMSALEARGVEDGALDKSDPLMSAMYSDDAGSGADSKVESTEGAAASDADGNPSDKDREK